MTERGILVPPPTVAEGILLSPFAAPRDFTLGGSESPSIPLLTPLSLPRSSPGCVSICELLGPLSPPGFRLRGGPTGLALRISLPALAGASLCGATVGTSADCSATTLVSASITIASLEASSSIPSRGTSPRSLIDGNGAFRNLLGGLLREASLPPRGALAGASDPLLELPTAGANLGPIAWSVPRCNTVTAPALVNGEGSRW